MSEKRWGVEFSKSSLKVLGRLERSAATRILDRLEDVASAENPVHHRDVRALEGKLRGFYRLRVGEYRAILEFDRKGRRVGVLAIVPRGQAY
ncbi:MAG: type II toxin-antitoxin system RelE/ParE family toxin [Candidatus Aminicenantes bacterium]|nr:type II toxin-antitoxin system RelE/ParE family toxin [Candidatus Aminicenantes bacterium]